MPDASPTKWHLAHTTWFFETFVLRPDLLDYRVFDESFGYLFNSYYEAVGARWPRERRGMITRPDLAAVLAYRRHVDAAVLANLERLERTAGPLIALGLAHEEQHQELILTDILHLLAQAPSRSAYVRLAPPPSRDPGPTGRLAFAGGVVRIGRGTDAPGFGFDNEGPRHEVLLRPYRLADRLVTNGEWLAFMGDGGYRRPELWLADGWAAVQANGWAAPLYWEYAGDGWCAMTLGGLLPVDANAPVTHVSLYEADAFARWSGARLPTEPEWEYAAQALPVLGNFRESGRLVPVSAEPATGGLRQMYGDVWEWTQSAYAPYPGYRPEAGAVGEYNGKFMVNQAVLRGGSCVTPEDHVRATYRNFFQPWHRWQFSGVRLAWDEPDEARADAPDPER